MTDASDAMDQYESDWVRVIYDATLDMPKTKRIIELARINGLFDPAKYCVAITAGDRDG